MRILLALTLVFLFPALSEAEPSFDCGKAESAAEELVCSDAGLANLDGRLAAVFEAALATASGLDAGRDEAVTALKAMQRGWIKGRDECWKVDDLAACVEAAYLTREAELVATWMLREPYTEAAWQCGGNPANEVHVMYFDTELPAIRVEYGDGVEAMWATPSGSGARYDGAFGRMFWEKGGEATFVWDPGTEQTCALIAG